MPAALPHPLSRQRQRLRLRRPSTPTPSCAATVTWSAAATRLPPEPITEAAERVFVRNLAGADQLG
ncbi:hypothetical protein GCM10023205_27460 [Yinghuangia aomiensis]|uniref:Uncharacterized protein n=1 Tax=Yinghuangia aomiensis TaxID=676205 RepID=A0ABP9H4H7_9ACTN